MPVGDSNVVILISFSVSVLFVLSLLDPSFRKPFWPLTLSAEPPKDEAFES